MEEIIFERMGGVDAGHGHKFEWEMTTLAYLRCQRLHEQWQKDNRNGIKSFSVANNVKGAENFDDIVIRVEYVVDSIVKNKVIFVQCKHIEDPSKNSKNRFETYLTEQKSIKKIFESFVKIEQCKEQVFKELTRNNEPSKKKQKIGEKDQNKLRNFFNGKNVDTEYVFYSNIAVEHAFQLGIYKLGEVSSMEDVTNILFNSSNNSTFELRLKEPVDEKSSLGSDADVKSRKQFQEKFRVFINQPEPEILIYTELQYLTETILDTQNLQTLTTEEIRNHFTSKNPCTALTEKSDIVATVVNFMAIRMKSIAIMKDFCKNFRIKNIFSLETTTEFQNGLEHNKIINIKTDLQKLELIKVKQVFNSIIPTECPGLFLHNEIDTEQWISARETRRYTNLKMIFVCSQTNYNFDITTIKPNEVIVQISECNEQQSVLREYLHQFSEESQNFILNAIIISQGVEIDIKSFCGESWKNLFDENTICDILQKKKIKLYEPLPDLGFYIDRQLKSKTLDLEKMKRKILGWKSVNNGIILFYENDKRVPGCDATYKIFENMQDVRTFVQKFRSELQDTYHLCSYCDNEPKLIYSFGKSSDLTVKNTMTQDSLLLDKHTKIKIISDVAGMGKSTTLLALAKRDKENNPSHLVFFMELNKYLERLKNAKDLSSTDAAINFLGKNILNLEEVALRVFMNACKESGKVALYFDAFDEISPDAEKALLDLLLTLEKTQISRIYVSSRPNYVHVLEETMLQKSMQFVGLTVEEKERALKGFWKELLIKEMKVDESVLKSTAQKTVQLLHNVGQFLNDILAIPLQIRMLATIYYESLEGQTVELSPVNISDLYEQFIRLHTRRFYVDKHKMQWDTMQDERKRILIEEKLRGATEVACQAVIPELLECNDPKLTNILSFLCDDLGLITNKNPPVFLHRTIAEYLAAKYVLTKMLKFDEEKTLCSILTKKRFNIVRRFINSLLVGNSAEMFCKKEIYQWGQNKTGNNPFHVASLEGNVEIMCFLLRCDQSLLNEENSIGETAIQIACEKSKPEAVKLLLTYSDCSIKIKDHFENTLLHIAMKGGNTEIIEMILRRNNSLLNKQNKLGETPLHHTLKNKNKAAIKFLLEKTDCLVHLCDKDGDTVLHSAARRCSPEVIEMILRRDRSLLNKQNECGRTPIHYACINNNEAASKLLLENHNCLVNFCDKDGDTVLHQAARRCSPEVIKIILRRDNSLLNKQNVRGKAPLHYACENKNEAAVKFLLENPDCLVNVCDKDGDTVLHSAASHCSPEVIDMIMGRDESVLNKQNERGKAPLHFACKINNEAAAKVLLENLDCLVNLCDSDGDTVLHTTARFGSPEVIEMIMRRDTSLLNKQNERGKAPLHIAFEYNNTKVLNYLLSHNECVTDICDIDGNTFLHYTGLTFFFDFNHCDAINIILQHENALINKQNNDGETPLHNMIPFGKTEEAKVFLAQIDCSVNIRDKSNQITLHAAVLTDNFELVKIILQRENVLINQQNCKGKTPLHLAASKYYEKIILVIGKVQVIKLKSSHEIVKLLIAYPGCSINMRDNNGLTALDVALEDEQQEIIETLLEHGTEYGNRTVEEDNTHSGQSVTKEDDSNSESDDDDSNSESDDDDSNSESDDDDSN